MKKFFQVLGNILWFIIGGLWFGISYFLMGVIFCITIIGIPLGIKMFQLIPLAFFPFGAEVVKAKD